MRRIVRDHIVTSLDRLKPRLDRYIAEYLQYPAPFPLAFIEPAVSIEEIRHLKIVPRFRADYPPVDVTVAMHAAITAKTRRREGARGIRTAAVPDAILGLRTFAIDVEVDALGTVQGLGYGLEPQGARLVAWWDG